MRAPGPSLTFAFHMGKVIRYKGDQVARIFQYVP